MNHTRQALCALVCFFACALARPCPASASEYGLYVAPRAIFGITDFNNLEWNYTDTHNANDSTSKSKQKYDEIFGGAIALGMNLKPLTSLPLRAEVEYAAFGKSEARVSGSSTREVSGLNLSGFNTANHSVTQEVGIQTLFFNLYYDIGTQTRFTPFLTAGIGQAFLETKTKHGGDRRITMGGAVDLDETRTMFGSSSSRHSSNFAWNVGAGLGVEIVDSLFLDIAYRFTHLGKAKSDSYMMFETRNPGRDRRGPVNSKTEDLLMHQFMLGLRWEFW